MKKAFQFEYLGVVFDATAEAFFEGGLIKYRVAFDSQLIVIREILHTVGSTGAILYVQDVEVDEAALPARLIQEIGFGLEDINFFPGSFVVFYSIIAGEEYVAQFEKKGKEYKLVYSVPANIPGLQLPLVLSKKKILGRKVWNKLSGGAEAQVMKKITKAVEQYEKENHVW